MHLPHYAYCPDPGCGHRKGLSSGPEWEQLPYAVLLLDTGAPAQSCPHCRAELRAACPKCGKALQDRPQNFCPACGASLFHAEAVAPCRICGRPVTSATPGGREVPVCSERCLRELIHREVMVCDQCGLRFMVDSQQADPPCDDEPPDRGPLGDFCSAACRAQFLAGLKK